MQKLQQITLFTIGDEIQFNLEEGLYELNFKGICGLSSSLFMMQKTNSISLKIESFHDELFERRNYLDLSSRNINGLLPNDQTDRCNSIQAHALRRLLNLMTLRVKLSNHFTDSCLSYLM